MRGTFVHGAVEWHLDLMGESWSQGSTISGKLLLKNKSSTPVSLEGAGVILTFSEIKKIQTRDPKAIRVIHTMDLDSQSLEGLTEKEFPVKFKLSDDCGVSDNKHSLYIACGPQKVESQLQLNITPQKIFLEMKN